ncbi:MAG TPA: hypothetical protein PKZ59_09330, partial [Candidatus Hydrogenedentes bacterium]|nr:hypothetical protein [Candidatus Hydrogenedentota bacterium]
MKRTALIVLQFLLMSLTAVAQDNAPTPPSEVSFMLPPSATAGTPPQPPAATSGHASSPSGTGAVPPGTAPVNAVPSPGMMVQPQTPPVVSGRLYAVHASGGIPQKLKIDKRLKSLKPLFSSLPFTSYEAVAVHDKELPWGEETLFPVNAVYTLKVMPLSMSQEGAVGLQARVEMLQDGTYVNALNTLAEAHMNQALLFRGLPAGADELLLVFIVTMPSDDQNQQ